MKLSKFEVVMVLTSLTLFGCGGGGSSGSSSGSINETVTITQTPQVESLGIAKSIHTKVSLGETPKDVYILLSNYADTSGSVEIKQSNKRVVKKETSSHLDKQLISKIKHAPEYVEAFRSNIQHYLTQKSEEKTVDKKITDQAVKKEAVNTAKAFYLDVSATDATLKKVVSASTVYGSKRLNIWVSNDSFGMTCPKVKCVTQPMVNALANTFLRIGGDNDIYDWVTNIYGPEWGAHNNSNLIPQTNEINILLTDIDNDNSSTGGVIGYFHPKNNFLRSVSSTSNENIMLYVDAILFANGNGGWSIDDFWPKEIVSTLAHEFQHMIHFYQKSILLTNDATDVWINEMLAESTEDLIASKIRHSGSRGVLYTVGSAGESGNANGRYPLFNANNRLSLTTWNGQLANYSTVNAFGAFLLRNYGGAKVLHDIMHNGFTDAQAVVFAVNQTPKGAGKTFNTLLKEWGTAVLLSDNNFLGENLPRYNTGGYLPNLFNNSQYNIGSVNFFNYNPQPLTSAATGTIQNQGNYYYKVGTGLTGDIDISLKLHNQTEATLIVK